MVTPFEQTQSYATSIEKDVEGTLPVLNARKNEPVTWSESGMYFKGNLTNASLTGTEDNPMLGLWIDNVEYRQASSDPDGTWEVWPHEEGNNPSLSFAQSELSVIVPDDDQERIEVRGTPYGPSRVMVGVAPLK
ncbi:hypothetical protein ACFL0C_00420 [Patescibacteria group bacterium]